MQQPEQWNLIRLECCKPGCEQRIVLNREELAGYDRLSRVVYCAEHDGRYQVMTLHGESASVFHVVDTAQPQDEQPAVIHSWSTANEPNARYLAHDFCKRHNEKPGP